MADVTFDGTARIITVVNGVIELSAADVYSWWKEWVRESDNAKFLEAFSTTGGDPISGTVNISSYFFLTNGWRIRPDETDHTLTVNGNLYVEGGVGFPFITTIDPWTVLVTLQVSPQSQTVSTGVGTVLEVADAVWDDDISGRIVPKSAATALKAGTYEGFITIDTINGNAGTGWPIGTHFEPVNNLDDALTIMSRGNVDRIILLSDLTIESHHDVSGKIIETAGKMGIDITFETGCRSDQTAYRYTNLQGVLTSGDQLLVENCSIYNLENFTGIMNNVAFGQGSEISISDWATIIQATSGGEPTNEPELSIGTADVNISSYTGNLKLINKTGTNRTVANFSSGNILIASSCTAGTIQLLGTGIIESDNSGVGCNVDSDGFISIENIKDSVWDEELTGHVITDSAAEDVKDIKTNTGLIPATL
jgi:hypothetical protein